MPVFSTLPEPEQAQKDWVSQCLKDINSDLVATPSNQFPYQWNVLDHNSKIVAVINLDERKIAVVDARETNIVAKIAEWFEKQVGKDITFIVYSP